MLKLLHILLVLMHGIKENAPCSSFFLLLLFLGIALGYTWVHMLKSKL
jgi:hypothetical protein